MKNIFLPADSYLINAVYLGLVLFLFSVILGILSYKFGMSVNLGDFSLEQPEWTWNLYVSGVAAPIIETIAIFVLFQITVKWLSFKPVIFILAVAVFAATIHMSHGYYGMLTSVFAFTLFSWEFLNFSASDNVPSAVVGVTITHALNNILVELTVLTALAS